MRLICFFTVVLFSCGVGAQPYPAKPVRFIVSFPPGGSADLMVRAIAPRMGDRLGQPVVVENRAGAGGMIGVDAVAKAPADGYTIGLAAAGALSSNIHLYPSMPYQPEKDLAPISMLAMIPFFLVANPSQPDNLKALMRRLVVTASARSLPALTCAMAEGTSTTPSGTWPPSTSADTGPLPL